MRAIYNANPCSLVFGTDLPSTRAPIPYDDSDYLRLFDYFDDAEIVNITLKNACKLYRLKVPELCAAKDN